MVIIALLTSCYDVSRQQDNNAQSHSLVRADAIRLHVPNAIASSFMLNRDLKKIDGLKTSEKADQSMINTLRRDRIFQYIDEGQQSAEKFQVYILVLLQDPLILPDIHQYVGSYAYRHGQRYCKFYKTLSYSNDKDEFHGYFLSANQDNSYDFRFLTNIVVSLAILNHHSFEHFMPFVHRSMRSSNHAEARVIANDLLHLYMRDNLEIEVKQPQVNDFGALEPLLVPRQ